MNKRTLLSASALLLFLVATSLPAKEKPVKRSELPPAAQKTADEQSIGATVRGYASETENGKLEYEVETTVAGHTRDVSIAPDGTVLEIEEEVAISSLPSGVRSALEAKAGHGTITKVESLTKGGKLVAYEAHVRSGKKHLEIQVGPDGKSLPHEE